MNCRGFCWGKRCFYSNYLGKNIAEVIISEQNIYSVKIFNTYFSTKLSFTNTRFHLHVLEKFLYMLQEVRSFIYFRQFVHAPSLMFLNCFFHLIFFRSRTKRYCVSSSCSNFLISMTLFEKKENAKVLTYALDNIRIMFVILWLC